VKNPQTFHRAVLDHLAQVISPETGVDVVFIRVEEQNMARKFGQDWLAYTHTVRRWI
jgi:protein-S-isoprenylcysteine O-methyltransferase Ste14